jgi:RES domain-containing protein
MTANAQPRKQERRLDDALDQSFPASDPPAMNAPTPAVPLAHTGKVSITPAPEVAMVTIYRVLPKSKVACAFKAEENRGGGRWTSPGVSAVYASLSPAGALLEFLVHLESKLTEDLVMLSAQLPCESMARLDTPPACWRERPYKDEVRAAGNRWVETRESLALRVPSAVCECDYNVLVQPLHPDFDKLRIGDAVDLKIDARLGMF